MISLLVARKFLYRLNYGYRNHSVEPIAESSALRIIILTMIVRQPFSCPGIWMRRQGTTHELSIMSTGLYRATT